MSEGGFSLIQEHYLKRELLRLQIEEEVAKLNDFKDVGRFGPPFAQDMESGVSADGSEYPILHYMFDRCVKTFPFVLDVDERHFWQNRVQRFLEDFAEKDISTSADRTEDTKRYRIALKVKKLIFLYTASGIQTVRGEKSAKIQRISDNAVQKVDHRQIVAESLEGNNFINGYEINVAGVRQVHVRRGFLYEDQTEYLIKVLSEQSEAPVVHVARKYSDFKDLDRKLRKEFPGKPLPHLPAKNKSSTSAGGLLSWGGDSSDVEEPDDSDFEDDSASAHSSSEGTKGKKTARLSSFMRRRQAEELHSEADATKLIREKQRTTLRGYLKELVSIPQVARSQTFLEFLFKDRLKKLTKDERYDMELRRKMDLIRIENQIKFFEIATERAQLLEGYMAEFKEDMLKKDGLVNLFREIRERESIKELSPKYQKFAEWCVIEFAATLYHMFMAEDSSPEFYSQIRRIHKMLPYSMLRGVLRYSNPMAMMKGILDLFLAQPFGRRSLLQNIFWVILGDDAKAQEKLINELRGKMIHPELMGVLDAYARVSADTRQQMKKRAKNKEMVCVIFDSPDLMQEVVDIKPEDANRVKKMYDLWNKAVEHGEDPVGQEATEMVDSFAQLKEYLKLVVRKRDKDMMQEFWSDGITLDMIRELITIFYTPLIKVFKSANIHESVADFERFMDDLIKVVDKAEMTAASSDPNQLVESFIMLCERHQESTFKFVHNVYKHDDGLFNAFTEWVGGIIEFLREGNGKLLDMEAVFNEAKKNPDVDEQLVLKEMDDIIKYMQDRRSYRDNIAGSSPSAAANTESKQAPPDAAWHDAIPGVSKIQGQDFGLTEEDLDDIRDIQDEEKHDADNDTDDKPTGNLVEDERVRRKKLLAKAQSQAQFHLAQKPEVRETRKLLPPFHTQLCAVLGKN
ncbi:hypothetical protein TRICI_002022 [Trichomonascus ciferrii]|uniref:PX domain-containing protein n=1 Tax=Trichomonascus ciferrii TaxID=44093 RepID=A0A642V6V5_9ASCO|nr:hypothetical protein TRICI_002022 [Trichomonascus ciferrii]